MFGPDQIFGHQKSGTDWNGFSEPDILIKIKIIDRLKFKTSDIHTPK